MKLSDDIRRYAPWEQEDKEKGRREKKRGIPPKTSQKSRVRAKPKTGDQDFLELYLMAREKRRLEGYGKTLGARQKAIAQTWKEVKSTMYGMQRSIPLANKEGIEEVLGAEKEKKRKKGERRHGNIQKMDWEY